jgi:hypothetical protein
LATKVYRNTTCNWTKGKSKLAHINSGIFANKRLVVTLLATRAKRNLTLSLILEHFSLICSEQQRLVAAPLSTRQQMSVAVLLGHKK